MAPNYQQSNLWKLAFDNEKLPKAELEAAKELAKYFANFREKAAVLASKVAAELPQLTDHSIKHLDGLWDTASIIVETSEPFNPLETFILGGTFLLHDLGNSLAAQKNGLSDLLGNEWDDIIVNLYETHTGRRPTKEEMKNPSDQIKQQAIFIRLRDVHAVAAETLASRGFEDRTNPGQHVHLIENQELRHDFSHVLGQIAASHNWSIQKVEREFADSEIASSMYPFWKVDTLRIAILLRCADAAHLDSTRAPIFEMSLARPTGISAVHWQFQRRLRLPTRDAKTQELVFQSSQPFTVEFREAWWMAFDTLSKLVHKELVQSDRILREHGRPVQAVRAVFGAHDAPKMAKRIRISGWEPVDLKVSISNISGLIERFGGRNLYGNDPTATLRELLANASDAIRARRALGSGGGQIIVRLVKDPSAHWLEVEDDGIGMSQAVLKNVFLDFGQSFWRSELARAEFPGLASSNFRPTGKFGIGFFSAFILGDQIDVITRNYKAAVAETSCLEFLRERTHQTLRVDSQTDKIPNSGTCVRIKLKHEPWSTNGLFCSVDIEPHVERADQLALEALVRYIAVAPDASIDVETVTPSGNISRETVVRANDWLSMAFDELVERLEARGIKRDRANRWRDSRPNLSSHVAEPQEEEATIGRFRLCSRSGNEGAGFCISVGGFRARWAGRQASHLEGIIVGHEPKLDRSEGSPRLGMDDLRSELVFAVDAGFLAHTYAQYDLGDFLLSLNIEPIGLKCFELASTDESFTAIDSAELHDLARRMTIGERMVILMGETFEYSDELGGLLDNEIYFFIERLALLENTLTVRSSGNLFDFALRTFERCWGLAQDEILTSARVTLGSFSNGLEVTSTLNVVTRTG